jgi:hypothetical protein
MDVSVQKTKRIFCHSSTVAIPLCVYVILIIEVSSGFQNLCFIHDTQYSGTHVLLVGYAFPILSRLYVLSTLYILLVMLIILILYFLISHASGI